MTQFGATFGAIQENKTCSSVGFLLVCKMSLISLHYSPKYARLAIVVLQLRKTLSGSYNFEYRNAEKHGQKKDLVVKRQFAIPKIFELMLKQFEDTHIFLSKELLTWKYKKSYHYII